MVKRLTSFKGCLLGLAVGDAMGRPVDEWSLEEIRGAYGPEGLRGFDCLNGYATVTAHTQLAAYSANGLLLGLTRGQMRGEMAPYVRYVCVAEMEWARQQSYAIRSDRPFFCWIGRENVMHERRRRDTLMVDTLLQNRFGTMEEPRNKRTGCASLTAAVPVGLFYEPGRIDRAELMRLGAETVALTHGDPTTFLTGAAVSYLISRTAVDGEHELTDLIRETGDAMHECFSRAYPQATANVCSAMQTALSLSISSEVSEADAMEQMDCDDAVKVFGGALYACLMHPDDIESAMITAVNHSRRSSAVAALTGAILGGVLGEKPLREFFLPDLEPIPCLQVLATDLYQGCSMIRGSGLFDFEWDEKYVNYRR